VKTEQDAQMRRALDSLERAAKADAERARQEYEIQARPLRQDRHACKWGK
jgi:hypothetical protein